MKIEFSIEHDKNVIDAVVKIKLYDFTGRELKTLSKFLDDPSNIIFGISDDGIIILSSRNIKALKRSHPHSKYDFLYISEFGILMLDKSKLQEEYMESKEENMVVEVEKRDGEI